MNKFKWKDIATSAGQAFKKDVAYYCFRHTNNMHSHSLVSQKFKQTKTMEN